MRDPIILLVHLIATLAGASAINCCYPTLISF